MGIAGGIGILLLFVGGIEAYSDKLQYRIAVGNGTESLPKLPKLSVHISLIRRFTIITRL